MNISKESLELAAQAWCAETTQTKEMDSVLATEFARILDSEHKRLMDIIELAWGVIANANGGNWDTATDEWKQLAWEVEKGYYTNIRKVPEVVDQITAETVSQNSGAMDE